ncbi:ABC transporter substrate-binding protein [Chlamydiia bacterium]|nr:ABC transporter substrate-binding protein [Chlamydiia bacterium]
MHSWFFIRHLGDGLLRYNPDNQLKPALAESYTIADDQMSVEFKLREAYWNDGTPITANDFLETWKRGLRNKPLGNIIHEFMIVKNVGSIRSGDSSLDDLGVRVIDDRTLFVELDYPIGDLLDVFASPSLYPLPKKQRLLYDCTIEGGAFRYNEKTKSLVLNEQYWDKSVKIKSIKLASIEEQQAMLEEFNKNNIDYCGKPFTDINPDVINTYSKESLRSFETNVLLMLCINNNVLKKDSNVYHRMSRMIDRDKIKNLVMLDSRPIEVIKTINTSPIQEDLSESTNDIHEFTILYPSTINNRRIAQLIQNDLKNHYDIKLKGVDWRYFLNSLETLRFTIARLEWAPETLSNIGHYFSYSDKDEFGNFARWQSNEYTDFFQQYLKTRDPSLLTKMDQLLYEHPPHIPLMFVTYHNLVNPKLRNIVTNPMGFVDFRFAYLVDSDNNV